MRFQQWGGGGGRRGGGDRGQGHLGIPHPQDIFTTERTRKGVGGGGICIDPQDSDHEQLEIEGTEYKCGPITSAAVFKGM